MLSSNHVVIAMLLKLLILMMCVVRMDGGESSLCDERRQRQAKVVNLSRRNMARLKIHANNITWILSSMLATLGLINMLLLMSGLESNPGPSSQPTTKYIYDILKISYGDSVNTTSEKVKQALLGDEFVGLKRLVIGSSGLITCPISQQRMSMGFNPMNGSLENLGPETKIEINTDLFLEREDMFKKLCNSRVLNDIDELSRMSVDELEVVKSRRSSGDMETRSISNVSGSQNGSDSDVDWWKEKKSESRTRSSFGDSFEKLSSFSDRRKSNGKFSVTFKRSRFSDLKGSKPPVDDDYIGINLKWRDSKYSEYDGSVLNMLVGLTEINVKPGLKIEEIVEGFSGSIISNTLSNKMNSMSKVSKKGFSDNSGAVRELKFIKKMNNDGSNNESDLFTIPLDDYDLIILWSLSKFGGTQLPDLSEIDLLDVEQKTMFLKTICVPSDVFMSHSDFSQSLKELEIDDELMNNIYNMIVVKIWGVTMAECLSLVTKTAIEQSKSINDELSVFHPYVMVANLIDRLQGKKKKNDFLISMTCDNIDQVKNYLKGQFDDDDLGETLERLSEILLRWEEAISGDKDSYVQSVAQLRKHMKAITPKSSGVGSIVGLSKLMNSAERVRDKLETRRGIEVSKEVKNVKRRINLIFDKDNVNALIQFCIENGSFVQSSLHDLLGKLDNVFLNMINDKDNLTSNMKLTIDTCRSRISAISNLLNDIEFSLDTISKQMSRIIGETEELSKNIPEIENIQYVSNLNKKASIFSRIKGIINEILICDILNISPLLSSKSLRDILHENVNDVDMRYVPKPIDVELNNSPDGVMCIPKHVAMELMPHFEPSKRDGFRKESLSDYVKEKRSLRVPHINLTVQNDWEKIRLLSDSQMNCGNESTIVIFEFGHRNNNSGKKISADVSKYVHLGLINSHLHSIMLVTLVITPQDHKRIQELGLKQSSYIRNMKMCDSAIVLCYIDDISDDFDNKNDDGISNLHSRLSIPAITSDQIKKNLNEVRFGNEERVNNMVVPPVIQNCLMKSLKLDNQNAMLLSEINEQDFMKMIVDKLNEHKERTDLSQFAPLKMNLNMSSDDICRSFYNGIKSESSSWAETESDIDVLKSLYCSKDKNKSQRLKDTFSTNAMLRLRNQVSEVVGTNLVEDLVKSLVTNDDEEIEMSALDSYMIPSSPEPLEIPLISDHVRLMKSVMWGIDLMKVNIMSSETQEVNHAQRMIRPKYQKLDEQARKDTCLYQIICSFMDSDLTYICLGRSAAIKNFNVRDPMLLKTTMKKIGFKLTSESEREISKRAAKDAARHGKKEEFSTLKIMYEIIHLRHSYRSRMENYMEMKGTSLDDILKKVLSTIGEDIVPILFNDKFEVIKDNKVDPSANIMTSMSVLYLMLSKYHSEEKIKDLYEPQEVMERLTSNKKPKEIVVDRLKSMVKRQTKFKKYVNIGEFRIGHLLNIPIDLKSTEFAILIDRFWENFTDNSGIITPTSIKSETVIMNKLIIKFCHSTSIIDDLVVFSTIASKLVRLVDFKRNNKASFHRVMLTDVISMNVVLPKKTGTLFKIFLSTHLNTKNEVNNSPINIDEAAFLPIMNAPYYFLFYLEKLIRKKFSSLVSLEKIDKLMTREALDSEVIHSVMWVNEIVDLMRGMDNDIVNTSSSVMKLITDNLSVTDIKSQLCFHAMFMKMISIPAICVNDKSHNTVTQNMRYIFMAKLSDQFSPEGLGKKMQEFSRSLECNLHIRFMQVLSCAILQKQVKRESMIEKKALFSSDVFIDPVMLSSCENEDDFISAIYNNHGYVRGIMSSQSNANVHNAFFSIPLSSTEEMVRSFSEAVSCCVDEFSDGFISRSILCDKCKLNMDKYCRISQIQVYGFESISQIMKFMSSSFDLVLTTDIKGTFGCPYFQEMVGRVAAESYREDDLLKCNNDVDLRSIPRTDLLQSTSIVSQYNVTFNPSKAQSKISQRMHGSLFKGLLSGQSIISDEAIDEVERLMESRGIQVRPLINNIRSGISPHVKLNEKQPSEIDMGDSNINFSSISDVLLQEETSSSAVKLLGKWIIWSMDSCAAVEKDKLHIIPTKMDIISTLSSIETKILITGEDVNLNGKATSNDVSKERMSNYEKLVEKDYGVRIGMSDKSLGQIKRRLNKRINESNDRLYSLSRFKTMMIKFGNFITMNISPNCESGSERSKELSMIDKLLTESTWLELDDIFDNYGFDTSDYGELNQLSSMEREIYLPKEVGPTIDGQESLLKITTLEEFNSKIREKDEIEFSRVCDELLNNVESALLYQDDESHRQGLFSVSSLQREEFEEQIKHIDMQIRHLIDVSPELILKHTIDILRMIAKFPISVIFPNHYMSVYDTKGYKDFLKENLLKDVKNEQIVSCLIFCYGDSLGESIIRSKNLKVTDPDIKEVILLTTPVIDTEFLIFPVIPILDASFRLGETKLAMMRMSKNGVKIKKTPVINIRSDRVVFELSSSISSTGIPLLWDSVATHLSHDMSFVQKIAAKAQFGGERDLVVQDLKTKETMALLERVSKQFLNTSSNDILVHPNKKKDIIIKISDMIGKVLSGEEPTNISIFSSDETKWGPTHNAMGFYNILKRLFSQNKNYYNLLVNCCILNISKKVLINPRIIESVLSFITSHNIKISGMKNGRYGLTNSSGKSISLKESGMLTSSMAEGANAVLFNCILRGLTYMSSFTHMGQGIFHATSSLSADCYVRFLNNTKQFISRRQIRLINGVISPDIDMKTLRSSDDSITIAQSRTIEKREFMKSVQSLYYMNTAVCHTMNMRKSVKHMGGLDAIIGEVYSTFTTDKTMIPSIKTLMAILTAPPSSTLLNTALMRYNLSRSCIENSAKLTDVVFVNTLAYSRDTTVHPKSSCSVRCGQSYPMCYSSRPDISMKSLFSDPFSSELDKITEQIRLVLYKFTEDEILKKENSTFDVRSFSEGDIDMNSMMKKMIESSEKEGNDLDIELHSALCCGLRPGEVFDMAHDVRRSVRVKESGIYSDVQSVPQSRRSIQKFNEVRSAVSNQLSQDKSVIIDLIELASTRVVPKTLDTVIIKASQSVRNQDPNTQRSLNPINAFNQSVHGILGWYFNVPTFIDCPRAKLTSGFNLTSAGKFLMWSVDQKKISTKENMKKFLSFHQYLMSLRSYITPFNVRLNEIETNCSISGDKKEQMLTGWRSLNKTIKSATIATDYNLLCSFLMDEVIITLQGHLIPHRIVMSDLSSLSTKNLNLITLPMIAKVVYDAARSSDKKIDNDALIGESTKEMIDLFKKYDIRMRDDLITLSIHDTFNIIDFEEMKSNSELFNQILTVIRHWSDLISSSKKQFNPLYIEVSGERNQSTEEDLIFHNLSHTFNYGISDVKFVRHFGGSKQLIVAQRETELLTLVSIGSICAEQEHEKMIQRILNTINEIRELDQNEEFISYNVRSFFQFSKPSHIGTKILSVESYQMHGQIAFTYKSKRTTGLVMLSISSSNDQSYLITEDPSILSDALEQIEQYIQQIKYKRSYKEIMTKLSSKSFNKGIHSREVPLIEDKSGNFIPNIGSLSREGVYKYALVSGIYRTIEPMSQIIMTKSNKFLLSRNRLTSITEMITDKLGTIVADRITIGSYSNSNELSISKRELYGEQNFRRSDVESLMEVIGSVKLRPIRETALNFFEKKIIRTSNEKEILEMISSVRGSENQIQSNGTELYVPGGKEYRKTSSMFISVLDLIYKRDSSPLNYNSLGIFINLVPVDYSKLRSKIDKVFGSRQQLWSSLIHLRTISLNLVGLSSPPRTLPEGMNMVYSLVDDKEIMLICSINEIKSILGEYIFPIELKEERDTYFNSLKYRDVSKLNKSVIKTFSSILLFELNSIHVKCKVKRNNETGEHMCVIQTNKINSDVTLLFYVGLIRLIKRSTYSMFNEFMEVYHFMIGLCKRDVTTYPESIVRMDSIDVVDISSRINLQKLESIPEDDGDGDTLYSLSDIHEDGMYQDVFDDEDYI